MEWTTEVGCAYNAVITVGATHTDTIAATIQLKDWAGNNLKVSNSVLAYLSEVSTGLDISTTNLTTEMTATTGHLAALVQYKNYILGSDVNGAIAITMGYTTGAKSFYLVIILPNGKKVVSTAFAFTA